METIEGFGENVRQLRESLGLTQAALAKKLELNPQTIRDYEAGRRAPTLRGLPLLARALGVSTGALMGEEAAEPLVVPVSWMVKRIASIPDDVYEMAVKFGPDHKVWDEVRATFENALIDLKENKVKNKKA